MAEEAVGQTSEGAASRRPLRSNETGFDLKGVSKVFPGGTLAVDDFNLHIDHGEYVVLLGPSGCGKTTTLRMIGGHDFPTSGDILLDGQSLVSLPPHKRPTTTVFQHFALFPHRTVLQNVEFGLKMHGDREGGAPPASRWKRSTWSASRSSASAGRGSSRAGSSSASRWRACSSRSRRRSCSTSRSATSTGSCSCGCASSCGTSSASSG